MYSNILLTHKIVVTLFLLHYVIKLILLQMSKWDALAKYTRLTKVAEMILSVGFLVTGGYMLFQTASFGTLMIIKLICVFASIPLAVAGFKRHNKVLATLAVILILAAYGLAEVNRKHKTGDTVNTSGVSNPIEVGKLVYQNSCVNCHGSDGKLGGSGAKDLADIQLSAEEQKELIRNGKAAMPGYKDLTDEQLDGVIQYIATFKE